MSVIPVQQLAVRLKLPAGWLWQEAQAGRIPVIPLGRSWRFDAEAVAERLGGPEGLRAIRQAMPPPPKIKGKHTKAAMAKSWRPEPPNFTLSEVCEYLGFNEQDLLRLMDRQALPFLHDGTCLQFPRVRVRAWAQQFIK